MDLVRDPRVEDSGAVPKENESTQKGIQRSEIELQGNLREEVFAVFW